MQNSRQRNNVCELKTRIICIYVIYCVIRWQYGNKGNKINRIIVGNECEEENSYKNNK